MDEEERRRIELAITHLDLTERRYRDLVRRMENDREVVTWKFRLQLLPFLLFWGAFWTVIGVIWWNGWGYEPAFSAANIERMLFYGAIVEGVVILSWLVFVGLLARRPSDESIEKQDAERQRLASEVEQRAAHLESLIPPDA
jgi:hypothetical protein